MPYLWPVEGGDPIRIVGPNVAVPGWVVDEAWVAGLKDEDRAQLGIVWDDDNEAEYVALRALIIAAVKAEATARITTRYSLPQQANMNMRATELVDIRVERELTGGEEAERQDLKAAAAWIKSVRLASNEIEAGLPGTCPELRDFDVGAHPGWPT